MGLTTLAGWRRRGFFIPYRYADKLPLPGNAPTYAAIESAMAEAEPHFRDVLASVEALAGDLSRIGDEPPPQPRWLQGWFPRLDAATAYAMVRRHAPSRIVEVGSGHSTRFMARAVHDGALATRITTIDPQPRAVISGLCVEHLAYPAHDAPLEIFSTLRPGDFLFVDSSHILMPGSDVDFLFSRAWPLLPPGVIVHIHDIFLPDDYPAAWGWRGYNEQTAAAILMGSGAARVLFASHYVATRMPDVIREGVVGRLPLFDPAYETSLWLEKTGPRMT